MCYNSRKETKVLFKIESYSIPDDDIIQVRRKGIGRYMNFHLNIKHIRHLGNPIALLWLTQNLRYRQTEEGF